MIRDANAVALFNLMGALAYKLTGAIPQVRIRVDEASEVLVYPDVSQVEWVSPEGAVVLSDLAEVSAPMHS